MNFPDSYAYILATASNVYSNEIASFETPMFSDTGDICLYFAYTASGPDNLGFSITVNILDSENKFKTFSSISNMRVKSAWYGFHSAIYSKLPFKVFKSICIYNYCIY